MLYDGGTFVIAPTSKGSVAPGMGRCRGVGQGRGRRCDNEASSRCHNDKCRACCPGCNHHEPLFKPTSSRKKRARALDRTDIIQQLRLNEGDFDGRYDFVYEDDGGRTRRRGGEEFVWPVGWTKLALNVTDNFNRTDSHGRDWLDRDDGWPVAFHGTSGWSKSTIRGIIRDGFKVRGGEASARNGEIFGSGIYCTPEPNFAASYAADEPWRTESGHTLEVVFQVRVRPGYFEEHEHRKGRCWLVPDSRDIRPCGILFREAA
jgi:hypothetical protein